MKLKKIEKWRSIYYYYWKFSKQTQTNSEMNFHKINENTEEKLSVLDINKLEEKRYKLNGLDAGLKGLKEKLNKIKLEKENKELEERNTKKRKLENFKSENDQIIELNDGIERIDYLLRATRKHITLINKLEVRIFEASSFRTVGTVEFDELELINGIRTMIVFGWRLIYELRDKV